MSVSVYVLYDIKSKAYGLPVFLENDIVATRSIVSAVLLDSNSPISKFQGDYELYRLGYYDDEHASIVDDGRKSLGFVSDIMQTYYNDAAKRQSKPAAAEGEDEHA